MSFIRIQPTLKHFEKVLHIMKCDLVLLLSKHLDKTAHVSPPVVTRQEYGQADIGNGLLRPVRTVKDLNRP